MASNALPSPPTRSITALSTAFCGWLSIKLVADQIVARLFRRCAAPDVDQAILGDAGGARFREAGHQDRAAHVDGRIGHHQLGVGPGDQPVVRRRRRDLVRREAPLQPGIGILRGDFANRRPQFAGFRHRLARGLAPMRRGGRLVERIDRDRPEHAELHRHRLLERGAALRLRARHARTASTAASMPARSALVAVDCASAPQTAATLHSPRAMRCAASCR